nr:hypothetical protein CFP56_64812 [Quercus suber]
MHRWAFEIVCRDADQRLDVKQSLGWKQNGRSVARRGGCEGKGRQIVRERGESTAELMRKGVAEERERPLRLSTLQDHVQRSWAGRVQQDETDARRRPGQWWDGQLLYCDAERARETPVLGPETTDGQRASTRGHQSLRNAQDPASATGRAYRLTACPTSHASAWATWWTRSCPVSRLILGNDAPHPGATWMRHTSPAQPQRKERRPGQSAWYWGQVLRGSPATSTPTVQYLTCWSLALATKMDPGRGAYSISRNAGTSMTRRPAAFTAPRHARRMCRRYWPPNLGSSDGPKA